MNAVPEFAHQLSFLGQKVQLGHVVADMEATLSFWTDALRIGPFVLIEESLGDRRFVHRGKLSDVHMSVAYGYVGDLQIEFISQTNDTSSPYTEFLKSGREGLHHLAFWPEDYPGACSELQRRGFSEVCAIEMADGTKNVSYFSGPSHMGVMLEIVPLTPMRAQFFSGVKNLAQSWDGKRPIRRYATRADYLGSPDCRA